MLSDGVPYSHALLSFLFKPPRKNTDIRTFDLNYVHRIRVPVLPGDESCDGSFQTFPKQADFIGPRC